LMSLMPVMKPAPPQPNYPNPLPGEPIRPSPIISEPR
jgi:hypothetical protein